MKNILLITLNIIIFNCNSQKTELPKIKLYRNGELVLKGDASNFTFMDSGSYCLVYTDSKQQIIDSSFYANGVLNGYSQKLENKIYAEGEYKNGKRIGWFKYLSNGSVLRSFYFNGDTLVQMNFCNSKNADSIVVLVPEVDMTFSILTDSSARKPQIHWVPIQNGDTALIYLITALSKEDDYFISIRDDLNYLILDDREFIAPCIKFKVDNTVYKKYFLTLNVSRSGKLVYSSTEILMRTPLQY